MSANHRITQRDIALFKTLFLCRALSTHQIKELYYPGPSASRCWTRLKFLSDAGFLKRMELPSLLAEGRKPYIYTLKRPAIQLIDADQTVEALTPGHLFLSHILDISEVYVRFAITAKMKGYTLENWQGDAILKKTGDSIIPDAAYVVTTNDRPYRFLLEVDKGTETLNDIAEKFFKYRWYFDSQDGPSEYEQRYGTDRGRVLFVAPSPTRMMNMKAVCEEKKGRARYWFTTMQELKTYDMLSAPIWQRAGSEEVYQLI